MIEEGLKYVASGAFAVAGGRGVLKSTVGPGLAVIIHCCGYKIGGLLHLPPDVKQSDDLESPNQRNIDLLNAFFSKLAGYTALRSDCLMEIVGGSDALRTLPMHIRAQIVKAQIESITQYAKKRRMTVRRVVVGGVQARSVTMDFDLARTIIRHIGSSCVISASAGMRVSQKVREIDIPAVNGSKILRVETGKIVVDRSPSKLVALLGSCIGVALHDAASGIGGLAHVLSPDTPSNISEPGRFAGTAVPALIGEMEKRGAVRSNIRAKIAGGANVLNIGPRQYHFRIGERNAEIIKASLREHSIPLVVEDIGGQRGRKMWVNLRDFEMQVKLLKTESLANDN